ncbi:phage tail sheath family protein [Stenomitos frigidus ULC18]|uniref:Phage tail sheath family protein n=1 Tax=Stenomitos frigidus ULC18 TaxID=2107698 RepID=A0A2T1EP02_9CYAN|nr:phage tail sheath family protein [Stenomitos frigidus ULC18]
MVAVYKDGTKSQDIRVQSVTNDQQNRVSKITLSPAPAANVQISVNYTPQSAPAGDVQLCTNFSEFKKYFGDFSTDEGQSNLAHAVYGFFRNGGTRCFVTWVTDESAIDTALADFAAVDEIAIVAVPGCTSKTVLDNLSAHCQDLGDRVAIFDGPNDANATNLKPGEGNLPGNTNYAALYYPWIKVFDPPTKDANPKGDGLKVVPPSGHIAGIYARVDTQRGVHKAPANEVIIGATDLQVALTRAKQDGLNPQGVNCLRNLNGNILVWGARTWGGDANGEFKYINVRRLFNYLRESIDEGTQWAVFEPNSPELWAKIRRSVTAFLTMVWRSGALFGATPQEAFFVQCDEETNPPEVRDAGQLIVKVGVAVVKPAEFVIFELSQMSGGK